MTGPLWPGCVLPGAEDVVAVELDVLELPQLLQLAKELGVTLKGNPTLVGALKVLRALELDESAARGQMGTRRKGRSWFRRNL